MTKGPPSSAAGPSRPTPAQIPRQVAPAVSGPGLPPQLPQQPLTQSYYLPATRHPNEPPKAQHYPPQSQWGNGWTASYPQSSPPAQTAYRNSALPQYTPPPQQTPYVAQTIPQRTRFTEPYPHSKPTPKLQNPPIGPSQVPPPPPPPPPSPPPAPPPKYRHWDQVIKDFLVKLGLKQALSGFECDLLVMNADFERLHVPDALLHLLQGIMLIREGADIPPLPEQNRSFEERKLDYVHTAIPSSQTSITKSISAFLAQNRAKNDASNRAEFLHSLAEKRKRIDDEACRTNPDGEAMSEVSDVVKDISSCARTDAKPIDRDVQMKYDIAKNNDGPLRRTTRHKAKAPSLSEGTVTATPTSTRPKTKSMARELKKAASPVVVKSEPDVKQRHFGLDQRLGNIETHFSCLLSRIACLRASKFLEDHIIRLEKDYPPWAALHFNQPNRGWPPPPRATPIIVPPHLRSSVSSTTAAPPPKVGGVKTKNTGSSLQRAVMDQLAMKEARSDLAGRRQ
ncbi:hypothetical protein C8R44DRAFT_891528 [Mycena epipterygia]|nr:hypothetical protein C8R44DRAFT_891528 [Mycena epipterygia]